MVVAVIVAAAVVTAAVAVAVTVAVAAETEMAGDETDSTNSKLHASLGKHFFCGLFHNRLL